MKAYQILKTVRDVANATPAINFFHNGDIYQAVNRNEVKYPILCMSLQSMTVRENYTTFTFQLYAAERLTNGEENREYAIAELMDLAEDYVHSLKNTDGILDVEFDRQYNNSTYQTMDMNVCIYGTIDIDVENEYMVC